MNDQQAQLAVHGLEEQFFKTFGIEQKVKTVPCYGGHKIVGLESYPQITAEKLLYMICIILNAEGLLTINTEGNIEDIKDFVLRF